MEVTYDEKGRAYLRTVHAGHEGALVSVSPLMVDATFGGVDGWLFEQGYIRTADIEDGGAPVASIYELHDSYNPWTFWTDPDYRARIKLARTHNDWHKAAEKARRNYKPATEYHEDVERVAQWAANEYGIPVTRHYPRSNYPAIAVSDHSDSEGGPWRGQDLTPGERSVLEYERNRALKLDPLRSQPWEAERRAAEEEYRAHVANSTITQSEYAEALATAEVWMIDQGGEKWIATEHGKPYRRLVPDLEPQPCDSNPIHGPATRMVTIDSGHPSPLCDDCTEHAIREAHREPAESYTITTIEGATI